MRNWLSERNRLHVLKTIRRLGPIARVELTSATGLSGATITEATKDLYKRGLISERRQQSSSKGRPRTHVEIKAKTAIVVGASVTPQGTMNASFVDLTGHRLHVDEAPIGLSRHATELAAVYAGLLQDMIRRSPFSRSEIALIAFALPGIIDSVNGIVYWIPTFPEESIPLAAIMSKRLGIPVIVEGEVDGLARAEHWFGTRAQQDDFSLVYVGLHIGMANFVAGKPRDGANGVASEFGHVKTAFGEDARPCICGARGCVTAYGLIGGVTEEALKQIATTRQLMIGLQQKYQDVVARAGSGEAQSMEIIRQTGTHLGIALANHINATDPGLIVILTESSQLPALLEPHLRATLEIHTLRTLLKRTIIVVDVANEDWRWKGAAALALEQSYASTLTLGVKPRTTVQRSVRRDVRRVQRRLTGQKRSSAK